MNDYMSFIGAKLYGFCGGYFGRDSYGEKTIEAIGRDWIVVREDDQPNMAQLTGSQLRWLIEEYGKPKEDD